MITLKLGQVCIGKRVFKCRRIPYNQSNQRMHWAVKAQWTNAWKEEVFAVWAHNRPKGIKLPFVYAQICVVLYCVTLMDYDGAYTAVKPLLDALKVKDGIGVIIDDSPKYIDLQVQQKKVAHRNDEWVEITIV